VSSAEKRDKFLSIWPSLSDELVDYAKGEKMPKDAVEWFKRVGSPLARFSELPLAPLPHLVQLD